MAWIGDTGVTLVCQGYHPWSPLWKRNQSLYWALATRSWVRRGLFVNPLADWRLLWTAGGYQTAPQAKAARRALLPVRVGPRHWAWTPVGPLPFRRVPAIRRWNRSLRAGMVTRLVGPGPRIVILNDPFADPDEVASLSAGAALVVLDLSDDFAAYDHGGDPGGAARLAERCASLAESADVVLAINANVAARYRGVNDRTYVVLNACHYERFAGCSAPDAPRTPAVAALAKRYRRIAGCYGWMMSHRTDVALLIDLMATHPDWGFVFVGPAEPTVAGALSRLANAHRFDTVPHEVLPTFVAGFDVCMLPNQINAHTAGNDPLKLYEYLASGKPVVATPTAGVERFSDVVLTAQTAAEFGVAMLRAVAEDSPERRSARQEVARANSWSLRGDQVEGILRGIGAERVTVAR